jgi:hypothetical protein
MFFVIDHVAVLLQHVPDLLQLKVRQTLFGLHLRIFSLYPGQIALYDFSLPEGQLAGRYSPVYPLLLIADPVLNADHLGGLIRGGEEPLDRVVFFFRDHLAVLVEILFDPVPFLARDPSVVFCTGIFLLDPVQVLLHNLGLRSGKFPERDILIDPSLLIIDPALQINEISRITWTAATRYLFITCLLFSLPG